MSRGQHPDDAYRDTYNRELARERAKQGARQQVKGERKRAEANANCLGCLVLAGLAVAGLVYLTSGRPAKTSDQPTDAASHPAATPQSVSSATRTSPPAEPPARTVVRYANRPIIWVGDTGCSLPYECIGPADTYVAGGFKLTGKTADPLLKLLVQFHPKGDDWREYRPIADDPRLVVAADDGTRLAFATPPAGLRFSQNTITRRSKLGIGDHFTLDDPGRNFRWLDVDLPNPGGDGVFRFRVMREVFGDDWTGAGGWSGPSLPADDVAEPARELAPSPRPLPPPVRLRPRHNDLALADSPATLAEYEQGWWRSTTRDRMRELIEADKLVVSKVPVMAVVYDRTPAYVTVRVTDGAAAGRVMVCHPDCVPAD